MLDRPTLLDVACEKSCEEELAALLPDAKLADEFISGVEWLLARYPRAGIQVAPNSQVWFISLNDYAPGPPLAVYYAFAETRVVLLSIRRTE